jgi:type IV secretory pathway TraG/TraD family ATPase VirD4
MLRLMPKRQAAKTWMVIDELASLRKLPQLATAMTQSRKANTALVLGFQAKSQLEAIYGHAAEAMLSQPSTKIVLATSEANSAKWLSDTIGQVEIERMRQSRSAGPRGATTFALERHVEPLVLPSEVEILPDRSGYLKYRHLVTPIRFPYLQLPNLVPGFVERPPARPVVSPRPASPSTVRVSHAGQTQLID